MDDNEKCLCESVKAMREANSALSKHRRPAPRVDELGIIGKDQKLSTSEKIGLIFVAASILLGVLLTTGVIVLHV
jgi:hypothetical protein